MLATDAGLDDEELQAQGGIHRYSDIAEALVEDLDGEIVIFDACLQICRTVSIEDNPMG